MEKNTIIKKLLDKLRRPVHVSYISKHLLRTPMDETEKFIQELVEKGLVEESKYGKGYYVIKNK
jgi:hypothetical protein